MISAIALALAYPIIGALVTAWLLEDLRGWWAVLRDRHYRDLVWLWPLLVGGVAVSVVRDLWRKR